MVFSFFYCVASTGSATVWVTELVEVILLRRWFRQAQSPFYIYYHSRCLSLPKAHSYSSSLWFRLRSITVSYPFKIPMPEPVEGTFSLIISVISAPHNHRLISIQNPGAWACRRHILILLFPVISAPLNHRVIFTTTLGAWACRRHIFQSFSV